MTETWVVRAGVDSVYIDDFLENNIVAIGWEELGTISEKETKSQLLTKYHATYPDHSDGKAQNAVSQVLRFQREIKLGDVVITYDRDRRVYYLGEIKSDVLWDDETLPTKPRIRKASWSHYVSRDRLSVDAKNTLGAIQTLFQVKKRVAQEILEKQVPIGQDEESKITTVTTPSSASEEEIGKEISAELVERAEEAIEERIVRLDWENLQHLVAGILRAMGYRTTVSPRGADRGVDIFASPDGLGLEDPRIFVEVKHRPNTSMGSQDLRSFLGGRSVGDKCLYVSTGGFTKDAKYEADRANVPIQLIALTDLRRLLVENYDQLDEKTRTLVPLRRVFILAD